MSPKDGPRDWDKELAEVDKLIAGLGGQPEPAPGPARKGPGAAQQLTERRASQGRRDLFATWLWFVLAVILGSALTWFWPYSRECGVPLYGYLGAILVFATASVCGTIWSWRTRLAVVHILSIGLLLGSVFLGAREVLPRIGYARQSAAWECPLPPRPQPVAPPVGSAKIDSVPVTAAPPAAPDQSIPAPAPVSPGQAKRPQ